MNLAAGKVSLDLRFLLADERLQVREQSCHLRLRIVPEPDRFVLQLGREVVGSVGGDLVHVVLLARDVGIGPFLRMVEGVANLREGLGKLLVEEVELLSAGDLGLEVGQRLWG